MQSAKMKCPYCGAEMNHHADKVFPSERSQGTAETVFNGSIVELHSCTVCGARAARVVG
jgi:NMD protein affecting ribosome stability and mRNA decay